MMFLLDMKPFGTRRTPRGGTMVRKHVTRTTKTRLGAAHFLRRRAEHIRAEGQATEPVATNTVELEEDDTTVPTATIESLIDEVELVESAADESAISGSIAPESTAEADTQPSAVTFTDADWEDQSYALMAEQAAPSPCPNCGRTGFFGPRALDGQPKFLSCRFCGHSQPVNQAATRLRPVAHDCKNWPEVAGAPYIWWIAMDEKWYVCHYCKRRIAVARTNAFMKDAAITAPADDPNHPWWKIPQNASYHTYYTLWEKWPCTKGRVFL